MGTIMVSVICVTYNHVMYIEEALQSILAQKTDFDYEVIVHDDASIDGTTDIVKQYYQSFPDKIRVILQAENQFSKGIRIANRLIDEVARGKYIALCEGDDYWIDEYKLQKQVDYMEAHSGCSLCFHNAKEKDMVSGETKDIWRFNREIYRGEGVYSSEETIRLRVVPTASMLFKKSDMKIPDLYSDKILLGDMIRTMCLGARGYSYCMQDTMSVYRTGVKNSVMDVCQRNLENHNRRYIGAIETVENIDIYTKGIYHEVLAEIIQKYQKNILDFDEKNVEYVVKSAYKVFIYGTGRYAGWCTDCMNKMQVEIAGYIVSDEKYKEDKFNGKRVYQLTKVCNLDSIGVVIGTSDLYKDEIIKRLKDYGISNYCQGIIKRQIRNCS